MAVTSENLVTIAGGSIFVSASLPATYNKAGYEALVYTEVGGAADLPALGGSANVVSYDLLSTGFTTKKKGQKQFGSATFNYASVPSDAGQVIMTAATLSQNSYSFKVVYNNGATDYVTAIVMGAPKNNGTADTVQAHTASLEYTSDVVFVAAP